MPVQVSYFVEYSPPNSLHFELNKHGWHKGKSLDAPCRTLEEAKELETALVESLKWKYSANIEQLRTRIIKCTTLMMKRVI